MQQREAPTTNKGEAKLQRQKKKNIEGAPYKVNVIGQCCKMAICTLGNKPKKCKGTKLSNEFSRKANRKILNTL